MAVSKDHILRELRRLAVGGKAPGRLAFEAATGIKEHEWAGVHWARWRNAVEEAGLVSSEFQEGLGEEAVLRHLAGAVRDLGAFPTSRQMRLRSKTHKGFPTDRTIQRVGTKHDLIRKLVEYSRREPGLEDVAAVLVAEAAPAPAPLDEPADDENAWGFVYLLRSGRFYKIGRSNAAGRRERELQIQLPEKAAAVHTIRTDDPVGIEAYWHGRFAAKRKNGEWFDLSAADVRAFKRRKFM